MSARVLVVEDDASISELVCYHLKKEGFQAHPVLRGDMLMAAVVQFDPDLIILDLMLPGVDGLELCRRLKQGVSLRHIPVIMVTAKGTEADIVAGLQLGADDYIPKPFSPKVLLARIRAVMRRSGRTEVAALEQREFGSMLIDIPKRIVKVDGEIVPLTTREFDILEFLSRSPGRVFTRDQLLDNVWQEGKFIVDRAVDVHIRGVRKKLGRAEDMIETIRGIGYRFKDAEDL
jgi:two-component system, OmpR family, alkaline phosphatase synthesis response regulator PhoP